MVLDAVNETKFFLAFTCSDQVSFFAYVSKSSSWKITSLYPDVSEVLALVNNHLPDEDVETSLTVLNCFTVLLYHRTIVLTLILAEWNHVVM